MIVSKGLRVFLLFAAAFVVTPLAATESHVSFELALIKGTAEGADGIGSFKVLLSSKETAGDRVVHGWSYGICAANLDLFNPVRGADLATACEQFQAPFCDINAVNGGITLNVLLSEDPEIGLAENSFQGWEDLVVSYRCTGMTCLNKQIAVCQEPIGELKKAATILIADLPFDPAAGGRIDMPVCGPSERIRVIPVLNETTEVAIIFRTLPGTPGCPIAGWSYGVCLDGAVEVGEVRTGADTATSRGGERPDFEVLEYIHGSGITRAVVIDFMNPVAILANEIGENWEDLVFTLSSYPDGVLRVCHEEVGDPPVDAVWNNDHEDSLDMLAEYMGRLDLKWERGDCNFDGRVNIADAINLLGCLFPPSSASYCACAASPDELCWEVFNANKDDRLNIADAVYLLGYIFGNGPPIASLP